MMTKILLVNPPLSVEKRYGRMSAAGGVEIPFGICYLAAYLREQDIAVSIADACARDLDEDQILSRIEEGGFNCVGLSVTTQQFPAACRLARAIKKKDPAFRVIIGGCHVSSSYQRVFLENDCFDYGLVGEGEITLWELLRTLEANGDLSRITGLVYRNGPRVVFTGPRERIRDIDSLPLPAFDLLGDLTRHYRLTIQNQNGPAGLSLITSRGCFGKCLFCDRSVFGNCLTYHNPEYVMRMIGFLVERYGIRSFMFQDDNFFLPKKRIFAFCDLLDQSGLNISWSASARIDAVSPDLLERVKRSGCWQISYGIESADPEMLSFYNKRIQVEDIRRVLSLTRARGIATKGFFIFGGPRETEASLEKSIDFMFTADLDDVSVTFFTPYPGIEIYDTISSYGSFDDDLEKMSCFDIVFTPEGLTKEKLRAYQRRALVRFYLRFPVIWSYLKRIRSFNFFFRLLVSAAALIVSPWQRDEQKTDT